MTSIVNKLGTSFTDARVIIYDTIVMFIIHVNDPYYFGVVRDFGLHSIPNPNEINYKYFTILLFKIVSVLILKH
jgi:hypothetical protein